MLSNWPLVGRATEYRVLQDEFAASRRPPRVVITGSSGVGRTRMAREALRVGRTAGRATFWAAGTTAASAIPLGGLAHLVPNMDPTRPAEPIIVLQQAVAALTGHGRPVLLAVDDADLLDDLSMTLLHQLAATDEVALVLTAPNAGPVSDRFAPLWTDDAVVHLPLLPLSRRDADTLLAAALGGDVEARSAERLWQLTLGNPLYLRALVRSGLQSGQLQADDGFWRWDGALTVPRRLADLVLAQLGTSHPTERATLEVLAAGEPMRPERLAKETSAETVDELERRGLLVTGADGFARTARPLHAEVLRSRTPVPVAARIAQWLVRDAPLASADPAEGAVLDANGALRRERPAPNALGDNAGLAARRALVEGLCWQGRPAEAEQVARLAPLEDATGSVGLTVLRAFNLARSLGRPAAARMMLAETAGRLGAGPDRDALTAALAVLEFFEGRPRRALELAAGPHAAPPAGPAHWGRPLAATAMAGALATTGAVADALRAVSQGWSELHRVPAGPDLALVRQVLVYVELLTLRLAGRVHDLRRRAGELHREAMDGPEAAGDAIAAFYVGYAALAAGGVRPAARWLTEADAGLRRADPAGLRPLCAAELARVHILRGDLAGAGELLGTATAARRSPQVQLAHAWLAASTNGTSAAVPIVVVAADAARRRQEWAVEAELCHAVVELGRPQAVADRLHGLAARTANDLIVLYSDHARAAADGSGTGLDRCAALFEERGALLQAAQSAAAAADAHERAGSRHGAAASRATAARLTLACGMSSTPALGVTAPHLTRREQEVAQLVARGLGNVAVARRLVLSVRTVETHLAHIYAKLGINSRTTLCDVIAPLQPDAG